MITLVRCGQTEENYEEKMQGSTNTELNDTGRRQCKKLKEKISKDNYDICFVSPLLRTVETAMILVGDKTLIVPDKRLVERELGEFEGKYRKEYDIKKYWDYNLNCTDKGVEGIQSIFRRCREFLEEINEKFPDKNILIVSHSSIIRAMHYILHELDPSKTKLNLEVVNCYCEKIETKKKILK